MAMNELFRRKLGIEELVTTRLKSEEKVSGYHAENIMLAVMRRFVLIKSYEPSERKRLRFPKEKELFFMLTITEFEAPKKKMRAALPKEIGMPHHIWNCSQAGALVAEVVEGDLEGLGKALSSDKIVEPTRAPLIPRIQVVKRAAVDAGAFGCTVSGTGPTMVAVTDGEEKWVEIREAMAKAFLK